MAYNYNPYYYNNGATPDMLNQFKSPYQQMQMPQQMAQQPIQQPIQPQVPNVNNDFLWVLGEVEATSYPVAPNNTVTLWDKNQPTIYIKSANAQGVPSMRILDFTDRTANAPKSPEKHECQCGNKFILKEDLNAVQGEIQEIMCRLSDIEDKYKTLSAKPTPKTTKTTKTEE